MTREQQQQAAESWGAHDSVRPVHAGSPLPAATAAFSMQVATRSRVHGGRLCVDNITMPPHTLSVRMRRESSGAAD